MLILGNPEQFQIFQYMDLILIQGDAIITCLDNLSTDHDTLQPKVKTITFPIFTFNFTVKLGVELLNNPKNCDQNNWFSVADRDLQQEKLSQHFLD